MGRKIAIFTDVHALFEPLEAIINDINKRNIKEIYSLGDNVGVGPEPQEVMDLLKKNKVISVAGNNEYYLTIGLDPFMSYFTDKKIASSKWTKSKLNKETLDEIAKYPISIEIELGGKKIALCHFANDVRIDYEKRSTWTYQENFKHHKKAYKQFLYTNSKEQKEEIETNMKIDKPFYNGYRYAFKEPLFKGKTVNDFDAVIEGHIHFSFYEKSPKTLFYTVGMAYKERNVATYIILEEKDDGFNIEEVYVNFDREKMMNKVHNSDMPDKDLINYYLRY